MLFNDRKNLVSGFLHLFGMLASAAGLWLLVSRASKAASPMHVATFAVFGASMILLYGASAYYHIFYISDAARAVARKADHMMIFVLIAGSYTPVCLIPLWGPWGFSLLSVIWGLAALGILSKIFWMRAPRWLYTLFYILMGWTAVFAFYPLFQAMPAEAVGWLIAGGVLYSVGGAVYALKWPPFTNAWFGFHEVFHVFCLLGSLCHFVLMWRYVMVL